MIKVFVSGNFNIIHPGHLRLLRFAKECGDKLIVGVFSDSLAQDAAHVNQNLRLEGVRSNALVDESFIIDKEIEEIINEIRPDIIVKGKEYEKDYNPEDEVVKKYGGKLLFSSGESIFSSIDLIRREFSNRDINTFLFPTEFLKRHNKSILKLKKLIDKLSNLRVCVIGDLIIDEYITCQPLGMSQEDPTIVVTPVDSIKFIGGAGIVASHASGLGAKVHFLTITGNDKTSEYAIEKLNENKVISYISYDQNRPTTLKQRYRCKGKSLLRVSHLHQDAISLELQNEIYTNFTKIVDNLDLLVFSDFNYGCLPQKLVDKIITLSKNKGIIIAADSQSSSQVGDIARFKDMDLITPTEHEARVSTRNQQDGLVILAEELMKNANAKNILLKMGEEGFLIQSNNSKWQTDKIAALNQNPKDVSGAGDSLLITSSMILACGGDIWDASLIGSLAAAIQVSRLGNTPLKIDELKLELKNK